MDAIAYIDESGNHDLSKIDPNFPVLTVAAAIMQYAYIPTFEAEMADLKRRHFGSDAIIMHSRDVRKHAGPFVILQDDTKRAAFYDDFNSLVTNTPFTLISITIDKSKLVNRYPIPHNPYILALEFLLERIAHWARYTTHHGEPPCCVRLIAESRGPKVEDRQLREAYDRFCDHGTRYGQAETIRTYCSSLEMRIKRENVAGLQLADMLAYPIARRVVSEVDPRTWDVIKPKIYDGTIGNIQAYGIKVFP